MSDLYKNKYRIPSARLENWDYAWDGMYFITICTKGMQHFFGEIKNGKMNLTNVGVLADVFWYEIKNHAKNITLDAFVVMPNHIHGILIIENNSQTVETSHTVSEKSNQELTPAQKRKGNTGKNSISSILGGYKSAVTKHANRLGFEFEWQKRFHDRIIRNQDEYTKISNYIYNNISNWDDDKFNPKNN